MDILLSQHICCKTIPSPFNCLGFLDENLLAIIICLYFWALSSIPLIYISFLVLVLHCFYYCSYVINLEIEMCSSFLDYLAILAILGSLHIHMNIRTSLSISTKKAVCVLIKVVLNLYISLGSLPSLTILSLLQIWHIIPFILFSFNFFQQHLLVFSVHMLYLL